MVLNEKAVVAKKRNDRSTKRKGIPQKDYCRGDRYRYAFVIWIWEFKYREVTATIRFGKDIVKTNTPKPLPIPGNGAKNLVWFLKCMIQV